MVVPLCVVLELAERKKIQLMKALYLSEWYPHRYDAMAGLFVQKHAIAVAGQGVDVCVLYLHHDTQIKQLEITDNTHDGIREVIVYYPKGYLAALRKGWKYVQSKWGRPDVCQLNVITKNVLLPLWLKWRYKTPYIIIEHWSGYLPENGQYQQSSRLHHFLARIAVKHASQVLTVSQRLTECMQACGLQHPRYGHINNVVEDFFFGRRAVARKGEIRLLHVSCFDERAKNVCGLLRAVKQVAEKRKDFTLTIVGTGIDFEAVKAVAESLGLTKGIVTFTGELTPAEVAEQFEQADVFVMNSNFENAPVVLSESLATGTPIIATRVGGIPEMVPAHCGCLVSPRNDSELAKTIDFMLDHYSDFDPTAIRTEGQQYSFAAVGQTLKKIYQSCMDSSAHTTKK